MSDTIRIAINGIMTIPGDIDTWTARAVTFCILYRKLPAEALEYLSLATFSKMWGERRRADKLRKKMARYIKEDWKIILWAHSNGADVCCDALREMDWPRIEELHLIAPASEADFNTNGLNQALRDEKIGHIFVYIGGRDFWLKLLGWCGPVARWFGYGLLGLVGPQNVDRSIRDIDKRVVVCTRDDFSHAQWFTRDNMERTMAMLLRE